MGTAFPIIYVFSIIFGIIAIIASYILHKKTRALSTLAILVGYLLGVVPGIIWVALFAFDAPKKLLEIVTLIPYISSPLITMGLLIYAVKLKNN